MNFIQLQEALRTFDVRSSSTDELMLYWGLMRAVYRSLQELRPGTIKPLWVVDMLASAEQELDDRMGTQAALRTFHRIGAME